MVPISFRCRWIEWWEKIPPTLGLPRNPGPGLKVQYRYNLQACKQYDHRAGFSTPQLAMPSNSLKMGPIDEKGQIPRLPFTLRQNER
jgi:hypothetical protein